MQCTRKTLLSTFSKLWRRYAMLYKLQPLHTAVTEEVLVKVANRWKRRQILFHFKDTTSLRALCHLWSGSHNSLKCFILQKALCRN